MGAFDDLFDRLKEEKTWGALVFTLKDGEVKKIAYQREFLNVQDALDGLTHEEKPGDRHDNNFHEKYLRSSARG